MNVIWHPFHGRLSSLTVMSDSARREGRENYVECCAEELLIKLMVMVMVVMVVMMVVMMIAIKHVEEGGCVQEGGT